MKYTLEMDDDGRRFWLCTLDSGDLDPLPPDFALQFHSEIRTLDNGETAALPLGTEIEMRVPDVATAIEAERQALLRVLVATVRREAAKAGEVLSDEDARARVLKTVSELAESTRNPAIVAAKKSFEAPPPPSILPASKIDQTTAEQMLRAQLALRTKP